MNYQQYFKLADDFVADIDAFARGHRDPLAKHRISGFLCVSAVTCYELAIKNILFEFSYKKHNVFGVFVENQFSRLNGRIRLSDVKDRVKKFGERYEARFKRILDQEEKASLNRGEGSIISAYSNLLVWRNDFAHEGVVHSIGTYEETVNSYELGKRVIECLARSMYR